MASLGSSPLIVDSHIHLYPSSELHTLAWLTPNSGNPLDRQHSVSDYLSAVTPPSLTPQSSLRGFVFVETDRKHDLLTQDFASPLLEISWISRIAQGLPRPGEGHSASHAPLVLGIVPWAPLPLGPQVLDKYISQAVEVAGPSATLIRGFRYLVQDKPPETMLSADFISSLRRLGEQDYVVDVGVDLHRQAWQGPELISMIRAAHSGIASRDKVVFIIDHIAKPDMTVIQRDEKDPMHIPSFASWKHTIQELAMFEKVYIKLSGCFSEMNPDLLGAKDEECETQRLTQEEGYEAVKPWLSAVLAAFGPERCMFGSDWPVCEANPMGREAWGMWKGIVRRMCEDKKLTDAQRRRIWEGTAVEAYGLKIAEI